MAKDKNEVQKIDEDSVEHLEQVRKGKPRKFVMICKGTSVISLVLYKKGSVDKFRKQAKEAGKGQVYTGVIGGKGMDIQFKLAIEDGFDKEPVKPLILKSFLEEEADFKCKPTFEIVPSHGFALDEDDPIVAQYRQLQKTVQAAASANPQASADLNSMYYQIGEQLEQDLIDEAKTQLAQLQSRLSELGGGVAPPAPPPPPSGQGNETASAAPPQAPPPPPPAAPSGDMTSFKQRLAGLKPEIDKAVAAKHPAVEQIRKLAVEAAGFATKNQFDAAAASLTEAERLLREVQASPVPPTAPPTPPPQPGPQSGPQPGPQSGPQAPGGPQAPPVPPPPPQGQAPEKVEFEAIMSEVEPAYLEHIAKNIGDVSAMRVLFTYGQEQAEAGQYVKAVTALKRLKPMLEDVAIYRQSLAVWDETKKKINQRVAAIAAEIVDDFPEASEEAAVIRDLLNDFRKGLSKTLTDAVNAKDAPSRLAKHREAAAILAEYESEVGKNDVIAHLKSNPWQSYDAGAEMNAAFVQIAGFLRK